MALLARTHRSKHRDLTALPILLGLWALMSPVVSEMCVE
jgi:hypothetical protein